MEEMLKDTSEEESDSVEEIVEMKPLPAPRLVTYHQSIPGGWSDRSSSNDSGVQTSTRDSSTTVSFCLPIATLKSSYTLDYHYMAIFF